MNDWVILQVYEIAKTLIVATFSFIIGMWYFNRFVLPKLLVKQGGSMIKQAVEDDNIKPYIDKGKKIVEDVGPIVEKLKKIDFDGFVELINSLKRIDPQKVNVIIDGVKNFVENLAKNQPPPPPPPPKS